MGAIASGGVRVLNEDVVRSFEISQAAIDRVAEKEQQELERRECLYGDSRRAPDMRGRAVILVGDGLATGATMRAAVMALRQQQPARIAVGAPISAPDTCREFQTEADEIVCAETPRPFMSVGLSYCHFELSTDEEVRDLLKQAANQPSATGT